MSGTTFCRPTFIGIGAAKSATTWCWESLRQHPDIDVGQPKEIEFFNRHFERGIDWYARHFAHPDRPVRGEISPLYMEDPIVAQRIAVTFPEVKLLVVLRDPYERALSNVLHDIRDCTGGIAGATKQLVREFAARDPKYVRRSMYATCLEPFLQRFPPSQFAVLFYEDLGNDARQFLRGLYSAVGVAAEFMPNHWRSPVNQTQDYAWPGLFKALRSASRAAKSFPPTHAGLEWLYRNTRLREWTLTALSVDRGRPSFNFDEIFGKGASEAIHDDIQRLSNQFCLEFPDSWRRGLDARSSCHAA